MTGCITPDLEKGFAAINDEDNVPEASASSSKDDRISHAISKSENQSGSNEKPNNFQVITQSASTENIGPTVPLPARNLGRKLEVLPVPNDAAIGFQRVTKRRLEKFIRKSAPMTSQIEFPDATVRVSELPRGSRKWISESGGTKSISGSEQRLGSENLVTAGQEDNGKERTQDEREGDGNRKKGDDDYVIEEKQSEGGDVRLMERRLYESDRYSIRTIESRPHEDAVIRFRASGPELYEDDGIRVRAIESELYENVEVISIPNSWPAADGEFRITESEPAERIRRERLPDRPFEEVDEFASVREYDESYHHVTYTYSGDDYSQDEDEDVSARQDWLRETFLPSMEFHDRLAATGLRHLFAKRFHRKGLSFDIALGTLQGMVVYQLQRKLVRVVKRMYTRQRVSDRLLKQAQGLLKQYSTAVRDYDLMTEKLEKTKRLRERDPFCITTRDSLSLSLLADVVLLPENELLSIRSQNDDKYKKGYNILPGSSRSAYHHKSGVAEQWERAWMGLLGVVALIGPMLLMVLHKGLVTALVTTSVATILFVCVLSIFGTSLNGATMVASVAAYAAVLVVFVGLAQGGS